MTTTVVAMLAFALLFVCWGVLRPADTREAGCHGCSHGDTADCGAECPLLMDAFETETRTEVTR
jgi:hypothetical protein